MKRKILALLLACMMVISMVPASVFAVDGEVADTTQPEAGYEHECDCADGGTKGDLIEAEDPTCDTYGYEVYECEKKECLGYIAVLTGSPLGHEWADATCTAPETCKRCGKTDGEANGHDWQDADCTTAKTCSVCKATEGKENGHSWTPATCTAPKTCTVCKATEGKANGHDWQDADCTTAKTCSVCKATDGSANGHSWTPATCTTPKTCTVCNATEGKENGHDWGGATCDQPATCKSCKVTTGDKLGHDMAAATCTAPKTCKRCGVTDGDKLGHDMAAATCTVPSTCNRCGHEEGDALPHTMAPATCSAPATCTVCGHKEGDPDDDAHVTEILQGQPATCQEDGYKFLIRCTVCEKVLTKSGVIAKSDEYHTWSAWNVVKATCAEGTHEERQCTACLFAGRVTVEKQKTQDDKLPHNYGKLQGATCVDLECADCGFELKAATDHDYGKLKNAPCVDRECAMCGYEWDGTGVHVYELELPACVPDVHCANCSTKREAEPHTYASNATCIDRTCTVCKSYTLKATTKHTETEFGKEDPTYDKTGMSGYTKCSVCNSALSENKEVPMVAENVTFEYVVEGLSVTTGTITIKVYMVAENGVRIEALQWGMDFDENGLTLTGAKFELANLAGSITAKDTANAKGKVVVSAYSTDSEKGYYTFEANKEGYLFATLTFEVNEDVKMGTKIGFATEVAFTRPASFKNSYDFNAGTVETLVVETLGDITGEGNVDVNDLVVLLRAINVGTELKYEDYKILDMDQSGSVDGADLIKLRNLIAGADADA